MTDSGYDLIKSWAVVWTWHTSHPLDERRFHEALCEVYRSVGPDIDLGKLRKAAERHANSIAGTPSGAARNEAFESYMERASMIISLLKGARS